MRTLGRSASVAIFAVELLFVLTTPRLYCQVSSAVNDRRQTKAVHPLSIKTSICEALAHPQHFDGRLVEIHAMFSATWEGAWLSDDECKDAGELVPPFQRGLAKPYADVLRAVAKRYSLDDVVRDKSWQAFDSASHRLYVGMSEVLPDGTIKSGDYDYCAGAAMR